MRRVIGLLWLLGFTPSDFLGGPDHCEIALDGDIVWNGISGAEGPAIGHAPLAPALSIVDFSGQYPNGLYGPANTIANDRGAKEYRITAGNVLSGGQVSGGSVLVSGTLTDGIGPTPPSGDATFETVGSGSQAGVRYITVEITSMADWAGAGIGLNEVEFSLMVP